jgi:hypothetical protein
VASDTNYFQLKMEALDTLREQIKNKCSLGVVEDLITHLNDIEREFRHVVRDRQKLEEENEQLKKQIKPKKEKYIRVRCPCTTAKGTQCRKFCLEGVDTCKVHSKPLKAPKQPKTPRAKRQMCSGINIRGNSCRNKCIDGKTYCERHDPDAPVIAKKTKRNKRREVQMHTHDPGEIPTIRCLLCETHGDMFDPNLVNHKLVESRGTNGYTLRGRIVSRSV